MIKATFKCSDFGKNWKGKTLNEDNLYSGIIVVWRKKLFKTGNRKGDMVELVRDGIFTRTVKMDRISLIK